MTLDGQQLLALLPVLYRLRDADSGALEGLLAVIAAEAAVLEENLEQLYEDFFIETCADWVVPYIGDLVGCRPLHQVLPGQAGPRAEVANTIAYRRRKGTASMLEQLARDVTGWDARVVEFFRLLKTSQYLNHLRLENLASPDLRHWEPLENLDTACDTLAHVVDIRSIARHRGRHNIPQVGIFLFPLAAQPLHGVEAFRIDSRRFLCNPLGGNQQLFTKPEAEEEITHPAGPLNLPLPISRRRLHHFLEAYYGPDKSVCIQGREDPTQVIICNLADADPAGTTWAHSPPAGAVALDPELGRIAFAEDQDSPVLVTYHYGFSGEVGGGEYSRARTFSGDSAPTARVPDPHATMQAALDAAAGSGTVEICTSVTYQETPVLQVNAGQSLEIRAADGCRPLVRLAPPPSGEVGSLLISGGRDATLCLNGLVIAGGGLVVRGDFHLLRLTHCTLVPGWALNPDGTAAQPGQPSLVVESPAARVEIRQSIVGGLRLAAGGRACIENSIVDAGAPTHIAFTGIEADAPQTVPGAALSLIQSTVIGKVHTVQLDLVSNSIILAEAGTWPRPVMAQKVQTGCVRFSYLPLDAQAPRRHYCQPAKAEDISRVRPKFSSLTYGAPGYCRLSARCAPEIKEGADDEAEMGVWHDLYQPQRETNLRLRLEEYLRCGLEAGIFYVS
jgi:hypothetical protein